MHRSRSTLNRLFATAAPLQKKFTISTKVTAITGLLVSGVTYALYTRNTLEPLDPSDPLNKFDPMDYSLVTSLLQEHQTSNSVSPRKSAKGTPLYRYDTSTINSNTPSEDRHCEHQTADKYIFG